MKIRGFTLIELLVSLAIVAIITIMSFAIFKVMSSAWKQDTELMSEIQDVRSFLEMMHKDISSAFWGETEDVFFIGDEDRLFFIALENINNEVSDLIETGYLKENGFVYKHFQAEPDFDFSTSDTEEVVCENVILFDLSYYDGQEWHKDWNSKLMGNLPQSVKILLKTKFDNKENTYQTVIYVSSQGD
jgi:prepilin-type N-terminal cleavage/methylation domain-containing protein